MCRCKGIIPRLSDEMIGIYTIVVSTFGVYVHEHH